MQGSNDENFYDLTIVDSLETLLQDLKFRYSETIKGNNKGKLPTVLFIKVDPQTNKIEFSNFEDYYNNPKYRLYGYFDSAVIFQAEDEGYFELEERFVNPRFKSTRPKTKEPKSGIAEAINGLFSIFLEAIENISKIRARKRCQNIDDHSPEIKAWRTRLNPEKIYQDVFPVEYKIQSFLQRTPNSKIIVVFKDITLVETKKDFVLFDKAKPVAYFSKKDGTNQIIFIREILLNKGVINQDVLARKISLKRYEPFKPEQVHNLYDHINRKLKKATDKGAKKTLKASFSIAYSQKRDDKTRNHYKIEDK
jgi:hypothetical protein